VIKYTFNKIKIIILFQIFFVFFINVFLFSQDTVNNYDSVNVRKAFFLYEKDWEKYIKNKRIILDEKNQIAFGCKLENGIYNMYFFVSKNNNFFGTFQYRFNSYKELLEVAVFFQNDKSSVLKFSNKKPSTYDIYLFGKLYRKNLPYYFSFDSLKIISLYKILSLLEDVNIDQEILISKDDSIIKEKFINKVIKPSISFKYVDDGARNEFGEFVYIKNENEQKSNEQGFNCSGFAKDVVDNYIRSINPEFRYLNITDLKKSREQERDNVAFRYKDLDYNPFFGLEWGKNLADKINQECNYNIIKSEEYDKDQYLSYQRYRGYDVNNLKEILFRDQQKDSTNFYILIFNRLRSQKPIVPEYYHIAIVVPSFKNKQFNLQVFESSEETSFNRIMMLNSKESKFYRDEKVVIIKIPIPIIHLK
jgi:hypothetical protein